LNQRACQPRPTGLQPCWLPLLPLLPLTAPATLPLLALLLAAT
jgi:hypothetical protein